MGSRFAAAKPITATATATATATGYGYGYVRDDGIAVIPIGTLSA